MARQRRALDIVVITLIIAMIVAVGWWLVSLEDIDDPSAGSEAGAPAEDDDSASDVEPGSVRGVVFEMPADVPVAGATVELATPEGQFETTTDAEGRFDLASPTEFGLLLASAPGLRSGGRGEDDLQVRVPGGDVLSGVRILLYEPSTVTGRVLFEQRPAEARVTIHYLRDRSGAEAYDAAFVETDADGHFRLIGLAPGLVRLRVEADGAAPRETDPLDLYAGEIVDAGTIVLRAGGSVMGRVLDTDQQPVAGALVTARTLGTRAPPVSVRTNVHGVYALYGVAAGTVAVQASAAGFRETTERLRVVAGREAVRELVLDPLNGIVVRVVDANDGHLEGAAVRIYDLAAGGDPDVPVQTLEVRDGDLYLSDLEGGPFRVVAEYAGQTAETTVVPGDTAQLVLAGDAVLTGVVLRSDGSPASTARVTLLVAQEEGVRQNVRVARISNGHFHFDELVPGTYVVRAEDEGHRATESDPIELTGGERSITLRLLVGGELFGTVLDATSGAPVAAATVSLTGTRRRVRTDADGHYRIAGFPGDRTSIRVTAPGYRDALVSALEVGDGQSLRQDLEMTPVPEGEEEGGMEMVGVGITVGLEDGQVVIQSPIDGGAGAEAGLQTGDRILAIDDVPAEELDFRDVVERIRGEVGTVVRLRVQRGEEPPFVLDIERRRMVVEN